MAGWGVPACEHVRQGKEQLQLEVVLADASIEDLSEAELTFDDPKGMFHFGPEVGLCRLNQIQKPALRCLWKHSAMAGLHGNSELCFAVLEFVSFLDADVASIAVDEALIPMEPVSCCVQLMNVCRGAHHGVDQARCGINADVATHPKEPLLALGD